MPLTLTIHHNIFLNRSQRYALHNGEEVTVIGVSVPVWYDEPVSTEPAKEIFCKYVLKNQGEDQPVKVEDFGYEIVIPKRGNDREISPELLATLNEQERLCLDQSDECPVTSESLLDLIDGGSQSLYYREHNRVSSEGRKFLHMVHFVQIRDIEVLMKSLE